MPATSRSQACLVGPDIVADATAGRAAALRRAGGHTRGLLRQRWAVPCRALRKASM